MNRPPASTSPTSSSCSACSTGSSTPGSRSSSSSTTRRSWRTPTGSSTSGPAPATTGAGSCSRARRPTSSPPAPPSPASTSRPTSAPDQGPRGHPGTSSLVWLDSSHWAGSGACPTGASGSAWEWGGTPAALGNPGATWHDLAGDQQTRCGAAPARPRAAAPRPRPDRPGVRAAAGRRGARPRRAHVGRAPQPPVPARLRRVAVLLPDDAAHPARHGAAASWRPQHHRDLLHGGLLVAGHLQHSLHRAGRGAAQCLPAPGGARDGGDAAVRHQAGDQTDQESRSTGARAAPSVTGMDITIHQAYLPHTDPEASLAFYRDTLGFEVRNDVGYEGMRWITVGPADQPGTSILLHPPAATPGITDDERRTILELMAKGTYAGINLATKDLDRTFERLQAREVDIVQEPIDQPYGVRDCAVRDPAGNLIRI